MTEETQIFKLWDRETKQYIGAWYLTEAGFIPHNYNKVSISVEQMSKRVVAVSYTESEPDNICYITERKRI